MLWNPSVAISAMRNFNATFSNDTSIVVGNPPVAAITYTPANINTIIGAVTDINDPAGTGGWTDLVDLTGGLLVVPISYVGNKDRMIEIIYDRSYEATLDIRLQVVIDDIVAADLLLVHNSYTRDQYAQITALPLAVDGSDYIGFHPIYCETSFVIRCARVGTSNTSGITELYISPINYVNVVRG